MALKPLAETVEDVGDFGPGRRLVVAGVGMGVFSYDNDHPRHPAVDEAVETINAAIEARERGWHVRFGTIAQRLRDAVHALDDDRMSRDYFEQPVRLALQELSQWTAAEAVSGDVACGLAFDLGAEKERTAAFGPLLDTLLQQGGQASQLAYELASALGLRWSNGSGPFGLKLYADDELRAECRRRGWHPEMGLAPRFERLSDASVAEWGEQVGLDPRFLNIDAPPASSPYHVTQVAGLCGNTRCSRFGTPHDGIPCDNRRARR